MNATPLSARLQVELLEERSLPSSSSYVSALYTDLLNRSASAPEVAGWVTQLNTGTPAEQVTNAFVTSPEFLSDEIQTNYQLFMQRVPGPAEAQGWLQGLENGLSETQMKAAFLGSAEFFALHGNDNGNWVTAVYQSVLGRSPEPSALAAWTTQLQNGLPRLAAALEIALSPEAAARQVAAAYEQLLGRTPDPAGLAAWSVQLEHGFSPAQLDARLASSAEYISLKGGLDVIPVVPSDPNAPTGEVFPSTGFIDICPTPITDSGSTGSDAGNTGCDSGGTTDTGNDQIGTVDTSDGSGSTDDGGCTGNDTNFDLGSDPGFDW